jgi:hypothetical protein
VKWVLNSDDADETFVVVASGAEFAAAEWPADAGMGMLDDPAMALKPCEPVVIVAVEPDVVAVGFPATELGSGGEELLDEDVGPGIVGDAIFGVFPAAPEKRLSGIVV